MKTVAIIGAGISGLTCAQLLKDSFKVIVFEKESKPGGLVRCERINGSLFHICGGHVFNTKNKEVEKWFWSLFDREKQFTKADRKAAICLNSGKFVDYPIENHVYQLDETIQKKFIFDMLTSSRVSMANNFDAFLRNRFGNTLYDLYFGPYNEKIWRRKLTEIPLDWLRGKLPMPTVENMLLANMNHLEEKEFVHSTGIQGSVDHSLLPMRSQRV